MMVRKISNHCPGESQNLLLTLIQSLLGTGLDKTKEKEKLMMGKTM